MQLGEMREGKPADDKEKAAQEEENIKLPIKVNPYKHQKDAVRFALRIWNPNEK